MNAVEEIKKSLYESYKWLYEENLKAHERCLGLIKQYRIEGRMGWAAYWLEVATHHYKMARTYKRSMEAYAS